MYYADLRQYLETLEARGKLIRIRREINKDTELMPLVRWQFRGLPEEQRCGFLFENVSDSKGKRYDMPVAVATHASSRHIYALALGCQPEEIHEKWVQAQLCPIPSEVAKEGPVQEVVEEGPNLHRQGGGLEKFPVPISTPGFDPAPFLSSACWITKDPQTGIRNVGIYRAQLKGRNRTGIQCGANQHLAVHWKKAKEMGKPLSAAIAIGGPPVVGLVAGSKVPYGMDELAVAGGLAGQPIKLVKCKSVDLEVPAGAEIVLEGVLPTDTLEPEAPFGEYTGYMGLRTMSPYFEISCLTHRKAPIFHAFIEQYPPTEGSKIKRMAQEANLYKFLKHDSNIPGMLEVALHEESGGPPFVVVRLRKTNPSQPWQALHCAAGYLAGGKYIVAVDEDIDAKDIHAVLWALSFRTQPHLDVSVCKGKMLGLDPSAFPPGSYSSGDFAILPHRIEASSLLIDATRKWDYPPISLPKREYMEKAREIWQELGLPHLAPKEPWFGYSLGLWEDEFEEEAQMALKGEHFATGEKLAKDRKKI